MKRNNLISQLLRTGDDVTQELMVSFLFTRGALSSQRFDVLPLFLGVSFSQTIHFAIHLVHGCFVTNTVIMAKLSVCGMFQIEYLAVLSLLHYCLICLLGV